MSTSQKVTNLDYLTELSKGNTAFIAEMISIFLTENPEEIRLLEKGIKEQNFPAIKAAAHKMKSTIPFVGLDKLIEKDLSEIEKLSLENTDIQHIQLLFSNVKTICLKASEELRAK